MSRGMTRHVLPSSFASTRLAVARTHSELPSIGGAHCALGVDSYEAGAVLPQIYRIYKFVVVVAGQHVHRIKSRYSTLRTLHETQIGPLQACTLLRRLWHH